MTDPAEWTPGCLLDLRRYSDGTFKATILGEELDEKNVNYIHFDSAFAAQQFTSDWYSRKRPDPRA